MGFEPTTFDHLVPRYTNLKTLQISKWPICNYSQILSINFNIEYEYEIMTK